MADRLKPSTGEAAVHLFYCGDVRRCSHANLKLAPIPFATGAAQRRNMPRFAGPVSYRMIRRLPAAAPLTKNSAPPRDHPRYLGSSSGILVLSSKPLGATAVSSIYRLCALLPGILAGISAMCCPSPSPWSLK